LIADHVSVSVSVRLQPGLDGWNRGGTRRHGCRPVCQSGLLSDAAGRRAGQRGTADVVLWLRRDAGNKTRATGARDRAALARPWRVSGARHRACLSSLWCPPVHSDLLVWLGRRAAREHLAAAAGSRPTSCPPRRRTRGNRRQPTPSPAQPGRHPHPSRTHRAADSGNAVGPSPSIC